MTEPNLPSAGQKPPQARRWLPIALLISVALNLLVVGIVVGARMNGGGPHSAMTGNGAFSVGRAIHQFAEPRREELWPVAKPHFQDLRTTLRKLRKAKHRFEAAYQAEPIDLQELDLSHQSLNDQVNALQQMNFQAIRALSSQLSPAERKQLLSALRPPRGHRSRERSKDKQAHK